MPLGFVGIHLAAKNNERADLFHAGPSHVRTERIKAFNRQTQRFECQGCDPQRVIRIVADAEHRIHPSTAFASRSIVARSWF